VAESYQHIRFPLTVNADMWHIARETNHASYVEQLIRQVLLTNHGDRINRPDFGCGIRQMVFMPVNDATAGLTQVMIYQALERWLGTVIVVNSVEVESQQSTLLIGIDYTIRSRGEQEYLNIEVPF